MNSFKKICAAILVCVGIASILGCGGGDGGSTSSGSSTSSSGSSSGSSSSACTTSACLAAKCSASAVWIGTPDGQATPICQAACTYLDAGTPSAVTLAGQTCRQLRGFATDQTSKCRVC